MREKTQKLLHTHLSLYPGMEVEDALKLLYQGEMGGGHLIEDEAGFADALSAELDLPGLFKAAPPAPEPVGGGLCRVYLSAMEMGPAPATLTRLCALAARGHAGSPTRLREKAALLREWAVAGRLPWPAQATTEKIDAWLAAGCPQPHHSPRYNSLYSPHYRLMRADMALYLPVFQAVDAALGQKPHVLVGIDGMSASGKSSLAGLMAEVYGCGVVHADDFFLQPHQRTAERLAQPGGNVDYERLGPVAQKAGDDRGFSYQAYSCQTGEMDGWRQVAAGPLTVLEGAYCLGPKVGAPCDVRVFMGLGAAEQMRRIEARSGPQLAQRFREEWIPMENRYLAEYGIRERCDVKLDTSGLELEG